jgi:hypothetical protein
LDVLAFHHDHNVQIMCEARLLIDDRSYTAPVMT